MNAKQPQLESAPSSKEPASPTEDLHHQSAASDDPCGIFPKVDFDFCAKTAQKRYIRSFDELVPDAVRL